MTKQEIKEFIEEMQSIGDIWTEEEAENIYGNYSLSDALTERKKIIGQFFNILSTTISNKEKI